MNDQTFPDALLAQALESANDAVVITSADLDDPVIEYVNAAFTRVAGYALDEVRGRTLHLLQGPKTDRLILDRIRQELQTRQDFVGEIIQYRKDGTDYPVEWRISPLRDPSGTVQKWISIQRDISGDRRFDAARERLAAIVDSSDDAIVAKNLDGVITSWNPAAERLFGYTAREIIGQNIRLLLPADRLTEEDAIISRIRRGERVEHFETIRLTKDTRLIEVSVTISPIKDETGTIVGASKIARDITERRLTEEALRKAKEAAETANAERLLLLQGERAARTEAERASRTKDEFLATLSHELRTPLNAVLGWASILRSGRLHGAELQQGLDTIDRNARVQAKIISDLLDMSRIISGKVRLDVQPVDLAAVLHESAETVRTAAEARGLHLDVSAGPIHAHTTGDPARLQQIFWNLLNNAIKFTPRDGRVRVRLEQKESHIEITVSDTGEGIAPEVLPLIFDRFQQADSSITRRHGGLGLGLSIVKQLVELHGGSVKVTSRGLGHGATFTIVLPIAAIRSSETSPSDDATTPSHSAPVLPETLLSGVRVLVVDDEPDARILVKRLIETSGATVAIAGSAADAMDQINAASFDVLVCDIGMPHEDGYTLIRRIRAMPDRQKSSIPAIALTAYARREDRAEAIRSGFQAHLAKPAEPSEIIAFIRNLVDPRSTRLSA